jgi:hypothetical protein
MRWNARWASRAWCGWFNPLPRGEGARFRFRNVANTSLQPDSSTVAFDPDKDTTPMPARSFVTHFGKQVHWDGAKDEEAVLLIMGEGPATSTAAEEK